MQQPGKRANTLFGIFVFLLVSLLCGPPADAGETLKLLSVKPTVFFVKKGDALKQLARAVIENASAVERTVVLTVQLGDAKALTINETVPEGKTTVEFMMPDIKAAAKAVFVLKEGGSEGDRLTLTWQPQRKWRVFFIPITHHDLGYTDTIENVLDRYADYYEDILRFCRETDHWPEEARYRYSAEGAWAIKHFVENRDEAAIKELGRRVKEGRIDIGALMGNQISALSSHEGQVRLMYPSFRLAHRFGGRILTGSITDVPGLSWGLPTILAGAGVKYFFAGLPTYFEWGRNDIHTFWDESAVLRHGRPDAFRWQGPDGQSVLVYYQGSYGFFGNVTGPNSYEYVMERLPGELEAMQKRGSPFSVMRFIHNGLDNYPPDVKISHIVRQWNKQWAFPKLLVGTNTQFFQALEKQCDGIRTFRGELPHTDYAVGALSTAKETVINRLTHEQLASAEKLSAVASLVAGRAYPADDIRKAYNDMALYDEHTWGKSYPAGRIQDWAWNEKSHFAYRAAGLARQTLNRSVEHLVHRIERKEDGHYIVVFNLLSFQRTDVVRLPKFSGTASHARDLSGHAKTLEACQIVPLGGPQSPVPYAAHRFARGHFEPHELRDLVFTAGDVPPCGYKVYKLVDKKSAPPATSIKVGPHSLENRFYRIRIDPTTGGMDSIFDKQLNREWVDRQAPHRVNQFVMRWIKTGAVQGPVDVQVKKGRLGPVQGSLVITAKGPGCPQITQEVIIHDRIKRIDFANRILKDATPMQEIYFAFPFAVDRPDIRFEGSNSVIKPFRDQFPGSNTNYYTVQHFADVSGGGAGVTLSARESHLFEFGGLWPNYCSQAHHGMDPPGYGAPFVKPEQVKKGHIYAFVMSSNFRTNFQPVQQGDILFRFSMTTHEGDWQQGDCARFGWAAANPFVVDDVHGKRTGPLAPGTMSFCAVDKPNVLLTAIKRAEDGDGFILRLVETSGKAVTARVTLPQTAIKRAYATDLVEKGKRPLVFDRHIIQVDLKPFGIATVRVCLAGR